LARSEVLWNLYVSLLFPNTSKLKFRGSMNYVMGTFFPCIIFPLISNAVYMNGKWHVMYQELFAHQLKNNAVKQETI
jgi:hypothetical protein